MIIPINLVRFNRAVDSTLLLSKASALPKNIRVKPDVSHKDRLVESLKDRLVESSQSLVAAN